MINDKGSWVNMWVYGAGTYPISVPQLKWLTWTKKDGADISIYNEDRESATGALA